MRAIRIHNHGNISELRIDNITEPKCKINQIKINIKAMSINHLDVLVRHGIKGIEIKLPMIVGSDASAIKDLSSSSGDKYSTFSVIE